MGIRERLIRLEDRVLHREPGKRPKPMSRRGWVIFGLFVAAYVAAMVTTSVLDHDGGAAFSAVAVVGPVLVLVGRDRQTRRRQDES